jgi:hypothetical protein
VRNVLIPNIPSVNTFEDVLAPKEENSGGVTFAAGTPKSLIVQQVTRMSDELGNLKSRCRKQTRIGA